MTAVRRVLPPAPAERPPIILVHGAANSALVWTYCRSGWLDADFHEVPGASHWGIVLSRRALAAMVTVVTAWVAEGA